MNGIGVTAFGVIAVTFMMATYAAERRHRSFVLAFAGRMSAFERLRLPRGRVAVWGRGDDLGRCRYAAIPNKDAGREILANRPEERRERPI
jgi:hypothetical protein